MRKVLLFIPLLSLAACGETAGWNPNYGFGSTDYGTYQRQREAALMGLAPPTATVPVSRPFNAPTAADMANNPWAATRANSDLPSTANAKTAAVVATPAKIVAVKPPAPDQGSAALVSYATTNRHAAGTQVWPRSPAGAAGNCARYATPADAQLAFLQTGGPQSDPMNLDPDGDGYVCGWDPAPLRPAR